MNIQENDFIEALGLKTIKTHPSMGHFDFRQAGRRILVVGSMGAGKTEYAARILLDSKVLLEKKNSVLEQTCTGVADRREVFVIRPYLDKLHKRFSHYPENVLAYRSGYQTWKNLAFIENSMQLKAIIDAHPHIGTWIIDETAFFDDQLPYLIQEYSEEKGLTFVLPTLLLNFRNEIFNANMRLLLEIATDIMPLKAYCEHPNCLEESMYTYRYYQIGNLECPAFYFDPLIAVGGDQKSQQAHKANYATRCLKHHYLLGKYYLYMYLKPIAIKAKHSDIHPLVLELQKIKEKDPQCLLYQAMNKELKNKQTEEQDLCLNSFQIPFLAETILTYLYNETNIINETLAKKIAEQLKLDQHYLNI